MYRSISSFIPGRTSTSKLGFVTESFDAVKGWMGDFVTQHDISLDKILDNMRGFVDFTDDKLDYLAAFLDVTTNYMEHTGIQSIAHQLVERAVNEI